AYYPYPFLPGTAPPSFFLYAVVIVVCVGACLMSLRRTRKVAFGAGFFLLNIGIILQLVPATGFSMADRYTYIASIGLFYLFGEGIQKLGALSSAWRVAGRAVIALYIIILCVVGWMRGLVWHNE